MTYLVGMDLHATNTYIGIIDEAGVRLKGGRVNNSLAMILCMLEPYGEEIEGIVVESTFNWYWLVDGLMDAGYQVHLAHPAANVQYSGIKHTDDRHDAFWLAELLRLGILRTGYIFPRKDRHLRDLLRKRLQLVQERTRHILSFKSMINRNTSENLKVYAIKKMAKEEIVPLLEDDNLILAGNTHLRCINFLSNQIARLEKEVISPIVENPAFEKLKTVPGIGNILAMTILLETGDIKRFEGVGNYASYCRCVSSTRSSSNKLKGMNNRKNGNGYLAWAFVEAAQKAKRYCPAAKAFYDRKFKKRNAALATKALAHKLARACYFIMRDLSSFDETKIFGETPKKRKVWLISTSGTGRHPEPNAPIGLSATPPLTR